MRLASVLAVALVLPACQLYFLGGDDTTDPCETPVVRPGYSQRLVNPETLACQTFSEPSCDPQCGPCPGGAIYIPPWGACESPCLGLSETTCLATAQCRVTRYSDTYYAPAPQQDDYLGCYPVGTLPPPTIERCDGLDAEQCSLHDDCTALYDAGGVPCTAFAPEQCAGAQFRECIPEARLDPGTCGNASCRQLPPTCPSGTTPGVANGCYTGACIPNQYCVALGG